MSTDARVVFETAVTKLAQKPETVSKAKPLYLFFHDFESRYGELIQIVKLEKRMRDLFPEDPSLALFSRRFQEQGFDPTIIRPIVSPSTQARPKVISSIETSGRPQSPPSRLNIVVDSPKRPLPLDDSDTEGRPQKLPRNARDVSPLKGAAGRRLDQQKRTRQPLDMPHLNQQNHTPIPPMPAPLPRDVMFLLGIIPKAETYHATKFDAGAMVRLIGDTDLRKATPQPLQPPVRGPPPFQQAPQPFQPMAQAPPMPPMPHGQYNAQFNGWYPQFTSLPPSIVLTQSQSTHPIPLQVPGRSSEAGSAQVPTLGSYLGRLTLFARTGSTSDRLATAAPLSPHAGPEPVSTELSARLARISEYLAEVSRN